MANRRPRDQRRPDAVSNEVVNTANRILGFCGHQLVDIPVSVVIASLRLALGQYLDAERAGGSNSATNSAVTSEVNSHGTQS